MKPDCLPAQAQGIVGLDPMFPRRQNKQETSYTSWQVGLGELLLVQLPRTSWGKRSSFQKQTNQNPQGFDLFFFPKLKGP
ncbi:MAG: hypothetical protein M3014_13935 [Chloroflexota bacterium]|nr:hypothetical protein [Chloroflexota bacterium]